MNRQSSLVSRARAILGLVAVLALSVGAGGVARAQPAVSGELVRITDATQWEVGSSDSSGLAYLDFSDTLLVSDGEVNEIPGYFTGNNIYEIRRDGTYITSSSTLEYSTEPTGITYNPANRHLFISQDTGGRKVWEIDPGPDLLYNTEDDTRTSFETGGAFGSPDAEGVAYSPPEGVLYIAAGVADKIDRVHPGPNGVFDGIPAFGGDDIKTSFSTVGLGVLDPEGVVYDSDYGHLYIVGKVTASSKIVAHVSTDGQLLRTIDISAADPDKPAGVAYAPSSVNPGENNLFIADRGSDSAIDGRVYEFALPPFDGNELPNVSITSPADGFAADIGVPVAFAGEASDPEDGDIGANLVWTSDQDGPIGTGTAFSSSSLTPGPHVVTATVADSDGAEASASIAISIAPNAPPAVTISSPSDGSSFAEGAAVTFAAVADDPEEGDLSAGIVWSSDVQGSLGSGPTITIDTLGLGEHLVSASAADGDGLVGSASVGVTITAAGLSTVDVRVTDGSDDVEERASGSMALSSSDLEFVTEGGIQTVGMRFPGVSIPRGASIVDAYIQFQADETDGTATSLTIEGEASDDAPPFTSGNGNLTSRSRTAASVSWTPPPWTSVGAAGTDERTPALVSIVQELVGRQGWTGGNAIVFIVSGSGKRTAESFEGSASGAPLLHVVYSDAGTAPNVTVSAPADGTTVTEGTSVSFAATAADAEDGDLTAALVWTSDIDGQIGTGGAFDTSALQPGNHVITASVVDSDGASASASIDLSVTSASNGTPVVAITAPPDGTTVAEGASVTFTATADDPEDLDISAALSWSSSIDGPLGDGASIVATPTPGSHLITASVTDSGGAVGADLITLTVVGGQNTPPTVTVLSPSDGQTIAAGDPLTLDAAASDAEEGDLSASTAWSSDRDDALGSGTGFDVVLSIGTHVLTASVSDGGGLVGSASVTVNVVDGGGQGTTLALGIASGDDDAEEKASGRVGLGSSDLELVRDGSDQIVGLRFTGVDIPRGAGIVNAHIQFQVDESDSEPTSLQIHAEASDDAAPFSTSDNDVSSRALTQASVDWAPAPWNVVGERGAAQRTPSLAIVLQEIVQRPGWNVGNALVFTVRGSGLRTAESANAGLSKAAQLFVEYDTDNAPPAVDAGADATIGIDTPTLALDGSVSDDGEPVPPGATTVLWSRVSGPGAVTFDDPTAALTTATFSGVGTHVLRLTADDGALMNSDDITVTVQGTANNAPPVVDAGADVNVPLGTDAMLFGSVADDGLPSPPSLTTLWSRVSGPGSVSFDDPGALAVTASFDAAGEHVLRLSADDGEAQSSDEVSVVVAGPGGGSTLDVRVAGGADDAEERVGGRVTLQSSDLELVFDKSEQTVGMRFAGVSIPTGANVTAAHVQFTVDETSVEPTSLVIAGESADDAAPFVAIDGDVSSRPRTSALVGWSPDAWSTRGAAGAAQRTSDLGAIVQEIVSRPGWTSGNALALIVTGSGARVAESFEGAPGAAPLLHIEYE